MCRYLIFSNYYYIFTLLKNPKWPPIFFSSTRNIDISADSAFQRNAALFPLLIRLWYPWRNIIKLYTRYSRFFLTTGIKKFVTIDTYTGALQVKESLKPGQYQIKLQAQTAEEKYKDTADLTLTIKYMTVCNTKDLSFVHSLLAVKIPQGMAVPEVVKLDKQQDGCVYKMVSQKPAEGGVKVGLMDIFTKPVSKFSFFSQDISI